MNLGLSEDERMIADAAADVLSERSDSASVRACAESELGTDRSAWQQIAGELGWCAVGIEESYGGMGMGVLTQSLLFEQAGAHLLCAPLFATVGLGVNLVANCGSASAKQAMLPEVAEGRLSLSAPLPSTADWLASAAGVGARADGDQWRLDGKVVQVPDAAFVDAWLVFAQRDHGRVGLYRVAADAAGASATMYTGWDATRRFGTLQLNHVPAEAVDDGNGVDRDALRRATAQARLFIAAEALGGAQRCLELTTAYVSERKQFGRAVGSFQAVKHRCAEMMVAVEALRSGVYGAARSAEIESDIEALAAEAAAIRAQSDTTYFFCTQEAIQLHGGVGFTWEYDPHLYFKRAQASRHWLGAPEALAEATADYVLDGVAA